MDEEDIRRYLGSYGWPVGLQECFIQNQSKIARRYLICDDSGTMSQGDGHRFVTAKNGKSRTSITCTRWTEMKELVNFHLDFVQKTGTKTNIRFLNRNRGQPIILGDKSSVGEEDRYARVKKLLENDPKGTSPIHARVMEVVDDIIANNDELERNAQMACLIIVTDGYADDGDILQALMRLKHMNVHVVIRLCTDDEAVVNYWNDVDKALEDLLQVDVLDDLGSEGQQVNGYNPWLTYGEPIHRMREFGTTFQLFDLLDERKFCSDEVHSFCLKLFECREDDLPHPDIPDDFPEFITKVNELNNTSSLIWNAVTGTPTPWINTKYLEEARTIGKF